MPFLCSSYSVDRLRKLTVIVPHWRLCSILVLIQSCFLLIIEKFAWAWRVDLTEDLGLIPSTHIVVHNGL